MWGRGKVSQLGLVGFLGRSALSDASPAPNGSTWQIPGAHFLLRQPAASFTPHPAPQETHPCRCQAVGPNKSVKLALGLSGDGPTLPLCLLVVPKAGGHHETLGTSHPQSQKARLPPPPVFPSVLYGWISKFVLKHTLERKQFP